MSDAIKKSIEKLVDDALAVAPEATTSEASKAEIVEKSEEAAIVAPAVPSNEEELEKAKKMKKADEKESEEKEEESEEGEENKKKMKKSESELGELSEDEVELIKAWRAEKESEEITKSEPATPAMNEEVLQKAITSALEPLQKALSEKDALIKGLTDKVEKMASQPAYDKRSHDSLETIEKSSLGNSSDSISKSQVLDKMLELQQDGKGVRSQHIAEFETTNNISNPVIKKLVMDQFK